MDDASGESLEERVARLERVVSDLQEATSELREQESPSVSDSPRSSGDQSDVDTAPSSDSRTWTQWLPTQSKLSTEEWLGRVGIGLLLFGLIFLFKYSIQQGWIGPTVRVSFGVVLGTGLLGVGLRLDEARHRLQQIFLGGSSAAFYTTGFAAHQLYTLLSFPAAFAGMVLVTILTLVLALRKDAALLGLIGTAGGLGTPFLLYSDAGSVPELVAYTCLILVGTGIIYLYRGWRTLLATSVLGGWLVLFVACLDAGLSDAALFERWVLQGGLLVAGLLFAGLPVWRALDKTHVWAGERSFEGPPSLRGFFLYALVVSTPFFVVGGARLLWDRPSVFFWSGVGLAAAGLYTAAAAGFRRGNRSQYASAHALAAAALGAYGLAEAFDGGMLRVAFALEGLVLIDVGRRSQDGILQGGGHVLFGGLALWLLAQFSTPAAGAIPLTNPEVLADLAVIGLGLGVSLHPKLDPRLQSAYRLLVWLGWLGWGWYALRALPSGHAYVSSLWGLTGLALLVGGTWRQHLPTQYAAGATLFLFVGKLFLVDLVALPALLRILLFLGAGGAFLALSYALPSLLPKPSGPPSPGTGGSGG